MKRSTGGNTALMRTPAAAAFVLLVVAGCGGGGSSGSISDPQAACGPYPEESTSPYVLPYEVGSAHTVSQGNCSTFSHKPGTGDQYAYDFLMPIGTPIVASRPGTVTRLVTRFEDNTGVPGEENVVGVTHADESQALYFHIARDGGLVALDQVVQTGDVIALSGNSGASTEPHLHFVVIGPPGTSSPGTLPITFNNTRDHPNGLQQGQRYTALPYQ